MPGPYPRLETVDPRTLRVSSGYLTGANPFKLARQIAKYGSSIVGMRRPWVEEDEEGLLAILDGMTRATRVAKLLPGTLVQVEVTEPALGSLRNRPTIADTLP
jgi:hypothetical protein